MPDTTPGDVKVNKLMSVFVVIKYSVVGCAQFL